MPVSTFPVLPTIAVPVWSRARCTRVAALAVIVVGPLMLQAYSFNRHGRSIRLTDEYLYHTHARSWYFDHDCRYENDMLLAPGFGNASFYAGLRTPTGYTLNHLFCGTSMVSLPFIAIADGLTVLHNCLADEPLPRDGYSVYYQLLTSLGHTLLGILGLVACYVLCSRYFAAHIAALATSCIWLGTSALYYVGYESPHSHAASLAWVALMLLTVDTVHRRGFSILRMAALGLCTGMMIVTRPQEVVWAVVPAVVLLPKLVREVRPTGAIRHHVVCVLVAVAVAAACYLPQAIVLYKFFGTPVHNTYQHMTAFNQPVVLQWSSPDLLRAMTNPYTGLLWTAPLAVLAMAGFAGLLRGRSLMLIGLLIGFALMYYVVACIWWRFSGFGHRYLLSCSVVFALGLCVVFTWAAHRRWRSALIGTAVTVFLAWHVGLFMSLALGYRTATDISPLS